MQATAHLYIVTDNQDEINRYIARNRIPDDLIDPLIQTP